MSRVGDRIIQFMIHSISHGPYRVLADETMWTGISVEGTRVLDSRRAVHITYFS